MSDPSFIPPPPKPIEEMSVEELEQESYRLTGLVVAIRDQAKLVQDLLGKRNEEAMVSALLGRPVHIVDVPGANMLTTD